MRTWVSLRRGRPVRWELSVQCVKHAPCADVEFPSAARITIVSGMRPKFNSETARAAGKIGGPARAPALSPSLRSMVGARAAQARWYPVHASHAERLASCLRRLASIVGQAMEENEPDRAIRALA